MQLTSFILTLSHIIAMIAGIYFLVKGHRAKSYELKRTSFVIVSIATVMLLAKLIIVILMGDSFLTTITAANLLLIVIILISIDAQLVMMPKPAPKISEAELQAIENQKIIDELNSTYLQPNEVVDDKL